MMWPDSNENNDGADTELCRVYRANLTLRTDTTIYTSSREDMKEQLVASMARHPR